MMNFFDLSILHFFNDFASHSPKLDHIIILISEKHIFKMVIPMLILWWAWFKIDTNQKYNRKIVITTFIASFVGLFIARGLTFVLPFRFRPIHQEELTLNLPYGFISEKLDGWSSFPSDHSVLLFTLLTGLFLISKRVGIILFLYSIIIVLIPRVYLGLHYPTDLIAGAVLGIIISLIFHQRYFMDRLTQPIINLSVSKPELFYPLFFFISYQTIDLFEGVRAGGALVKTLLFYP